MRMAARLGTALLALGLSGAAGAADNPLTLEAINQAQLTAGDGGRASGK